ncbi:hypothetical protein ACFQ1L_14815 [Phytohabitans flavus]|nr:hypothetical protein [Phytohabitans flavus]
MLPVFPPPRGQQLYHQRKAECPDCGGETGVRACPHCHTPLSANFGGNSRLIAMVGAKGTGKTVYLTVLARELNAGLRRRFEADVRMSGDSQAGSQSPRQWLDQNVERLFTERQLFPTTPPAENGHRLPLVFQWRREHPRFARKPTYRTSFLSFYDTAGETLSSQPSTHDLEYIGAADALIVLLDPFMLPAARDRLNLPGSAIMSQESTVDVVHRVTENLRSAHGIPGGGRIKIPVAVVLAKMDAFFSALGSDHPLRQPPEATPYYDERLGQDTHKRVGELLSNWRGDDIDIHLKYSYEDFRYFFVSALGAPPNYDTATLEDEHGVQPFRVDEPLVWLLAKFGVVPTKDPR